MNMYKKWSDPGGSYFWFIYNNLVSFIYLIPKKTKSRSKSFMHFMRKFWIKSTVGQMVQPAWQRGAMALCSVISAHDLCFLKFLISWWSQVFFSAALPSPEVSAGNCSVPSLAQSLKIFSLPTKQKYLTIVSGLAQNIDPDHSSSKKSWIAHYCWLHYTL